MSASRGRMMASETRTAARGPPSAWSGLRLAACAGKRLDARREAALVSRRLVLVDDALARERVDGRLLGLVGFLRGLGVARVDRGVIFLIAVRISERMLTLCARWRMDLRARLA